MQLRSHIPKQTVASGRSQAPDKQMALGVRGAGEPAHLSVLKQSTHGGADMPKGQSLTIWTLVRLTQQS